MQKLFISGRPVNPGVEARPAHRVLLLFSILVFSFCVSLLYMGMRDVMRLGGFVASGGPYQIAHEAPGWVWIFPVSVFLILGSMFASFFAGSKVAGPNLMSLSWSALFMALGWNFVEFGFGTGTGGGLVWGWVVCAALFMLMGGIPLLIIVASFLKSLEERRTRRTDDGGQSWGISLLLQSAAAAGGVLLGLYFFRILV
ncbi:MAG: hypothetical protein JXA64_03125 [Candidatus Fermentibacteraceae bacterium]|nr:hypothetical protein [Candidatus Fermentibacteraceae bacterium]MBN2608083.1 hypothetical protein [Candidatus Fermentibacteraceae bacterium]